MGSFSSSAPAKGKPVGARPIAVVLDEIVTRAKDFTNADGAAIAIRDGDAAVTRATTGGIAPDIGVRLTIEGSFAGMALKQGKALHCEDSDSDPRVDAEKCRVLKTRSFVVVPIRGSAQNEFAGVLAVFSSSPFAFTRTDLAVLKTTADQVAYELKNAKEGSEAQPAALEDAPVVVPTIKEIVAEKPAAAPAKVEPTTSIAPIVEPPAPVIEKPVPVAQAAPSTPAPKPPVKPVEEAPVVKPVEAKEIEQTAVTAAPIVVSPPKRQPMPKSSEHRKESPKLKDEGSLVSLAEAIEAPPKPLAPPPPVAPVINKAAEPTPSSPLPPDAYDQWRGFATVQEPPAKSNKMLIIVGAAVVVVVIAVLGIRGLMSGKAESAAKSATANAAPSTSPVPTPTAAPAAETTAATQPSPKTAEPKQARTSPPPQESEKPAAKAPERQVAVVSNSSVPVKRVAEPDAAAPQITMATSPGIALPETKAVVPNAPKMRQSQLEPSELLRKVPPKYPSFPPNLPAVETVILRATVRADGNVGNVQVVKGNRAFAEAAITAVKQWKYKPAKMDGNPVETSVEVVLNFRK